MSVALRRGALSGAAALATAAALAAAPVAGAAIRRTAAEHHVAAKHRVAKPGGMPAPALQSPAPGASVQSLPPFTWASARGAASYDFQFSTDRRFTSNVNGFGGERLNTTAIADTKTVADGTYYWRVRGVSASDHPGPWSATRTVRKAWQTAPVLTTPPGTTIQWPSSPPLLQWQPTPYAVAYNIYIGTDPTFANMVLGSPNSPPQISGSTQFVFPGTLAPGTYYWAVQPVDAENDKGPRSAVSSFAWAWNTATAPSVSNINAAPSVFDPQFSWPAVPGAAKYQVEVNSSQDFPAGSRRCCDDSVIGTSLSPKQFMPNETTLYWRVRAVDVNGDAGQWNPGLPFTESYDLLTPTVRNLNLVDTQGNPMAAGSTTPSPIVTWDPVPGASSYEFEFTSFDGIGCDWSKASNTLQTTATNAWTPFGSGQHVGPSAWPNPEGGTEPAPGSGAWCFRVLARRDDGAQGGQGQVISDWTQLGGFNQPAFTFAAPTAGTGPPAQTPAANYVRPAAGGSVPNLVRTPLFSWTSVPGANGYYVVVARDQAFTDVVDVGYTRTTAYAPRVQNRAPYADESTAYYWAVVPAANANGTGVYSDPENGQDNPQLFNKSSVPPGRVAPADGAVVPTQPTFQWTTAEGARNYRLQIAGDPTFGAPLEDLTTDSTSYTSETTLPADRTLYWRVRANDTTNQGLNWSTTGTFVHHLPAPTAAPGNPLGGDLAPVFTWTPVTGAISYDVHIDPAPGGGSADGASASSSASFKYLNGPGIFRWQVRANFPGNQSSAYFAPEGTYIHTLPPPSGVRATKSGARILITWAPDKDAKQYRVELSATDGFGSTLASDTTDNTGWVPQFDPTAASKTLYWRLAIVDPGGNVGAYQTGVFRAPHKAAPHKKHKKSAKRKRTAKTKR